MGAVTDLLSHPLVQKNLEKLNAKQRALVELLESKGPQDTERLSLFLEVNPKSVPDFVYKINGKIPRLIENVQGRYASRLARLFPITEEAKAESKELEELRSKVQQTTESLSKAQETVKELTIEVARLKTERDDLVKKLNATKAVPQKTTEEKAPDRPPQPTVEDPQSTIGVEATLRRTLTSLNVAVNKEVLDIDESSWEGKILARGLDGFFQEPKGIRKIMSELVRKYSIADGGGNRDTVNDRLAMLVSKGILDRKQEAKQWMYFATPEFQERVTKT
jgi:regulator of replication initiation timing